MYFQNIPPKLTCVSHKKKQLDTKRCIVLKAYSQDSIFRNTEQFLQLFK